MERRLRVNQIFSTDDGLAADDISFALAALNQTGRSGEFAPSGFCRGRSAVNQVKRHFCRFAEQGFDIFWILQAGQLNHDAVNALALNNRFFSTQFVNTASDDFNRLVDNLHFQLVQFDVAVFDFYLTVGVFRRLNAVVDFLNKLAALLREFAFSILTFTESAPAFRF